MERAEKDKVKMHHDDVLLLLLLMMMMMMMNTIKFQLNINIDHKPLITKNVSNYLRRISSHVTLRLIA